jgi:hypothetical protein
MAKTILFLPSLSLNNFHSRLHTKSRTDSRTGGTQKNSEADPQHQAVPRPPSRPTSADGTLPPSLSLSLLCLGHLCLYAGNNQASVMTK